MRFLFKDWDKRPKRLRYALTLQLYYWFFLIWSFFVPDGSQRHTVLMACYLVSILASVIIILSYIRQSKKRFEIWKENLASINKIILEAEASGKFNLEQYRHHYNNIVNLHAKDKSYPLPIYSPTQVQQLLAMGGVELIVNEPKT